MWRFSSISSGEKPMAMDRPDNRSVALAAPRRTSSGVLPRAPLGAPRLWGGPARPRASRVATRRRTGERRTPRWRGEAAPGAGGVGPGGGLRGREGARTGRRQRGCARKRAVCCAPLIPASPGDCGGCSAPSNVSCQERAGAMRGGTAARVRCRRRRVPTAAWGLAAMIRSAPRRQHERAQGAFRPHSGGRQGIISRSKPGRIRILNAFFGLCREHLPMIPLLALP